MSTTKPTATATEGWASTDRAMSMLDAGANNMTLLARSGLVNWRWVGRSRVWEVESLDAFIRECPQGGDQPPNFTTVLAHVAKARGVDLPGSLAA